MFGMKKKATIEHVDKVERMLHKKVNEVDARIPDFLIARLGVLEKHGAALEKRVDELAKVVAKMSRK